jgi:hypothetical protein
MLRTPAPGLARDLRTAVIAAVVTLLVAATPSIAAKVKNADKVDGKHAVGAKASPAKRGGKLATDKSGHLPADIIIKANDADRLDGQDSTSFRPRVLARGDQVTGVYGAWGGNSTYVGSEETFLAELPVALPASRVTSLAASGPFTAQCPGPGRVAVNGWLCLYEATGNTGPVTVSNPANAQFGAGTMGFSTYALCTTASCIYYGTYAVRAGDANDGL